MGISSLAVPSQLAKVCGESLAPLFLLRKTLKSRGSRRLSLGFLCLCQSLLCYTAFSGNFSYSDETSKDRIEQAPHLAGVGKKTKAASFTHLPQNVIIECGEMEPGASLSFDLILKDDTGTDLILEQQHSSCGCLIAGQIEGNLSPGSTTSIPVDLSARQAIGTFATDLKLYWTDHGTTPLTLTFRYQTRGPVALLDDVIRFSKSAKTATIRLEIKDDVEIFNI